MNKKSRISNTTRRKLFIGNNLFIFVMTAIMVTITLVFGSVASQKDNLPFAYWQHIATFTILSNIFLGIIALISVIISIKHFNKPLPHRLNVLYLVASTSAMLTFLTVVCYLAPSRAFQGKNMFDMLTGPMLFLHFLDPIISAITYVFLLDGPKTTKKEKLFALIPPGLYAIPYALLIVILKVVPDFYGLTFGGRYYLSLLVVAVFGIITYGIASFLTFMRNRQISKNN